VFSAKTSLIIGIIAHLCSYYTTSLDRLICLVTTQTLAMKKGWTVITFTSMSLVKERILRDIARIQPILSFCFEKVSKKIGMPKVRAKPKVGTMITVPLQKIFH